MSCRRFVQKLCPCVQLRAMHRGWQVACMRHRSLQAGLHIRQRPGGDPKLGRMQTRQKLPQVLWQNGDVLWWAGEVAADRVDR